MRMENLANGVTESILFSTPKSTFLCLIHPGYKIDHSENNHPYSNYIIKPLGSCLKHPLFDQKLKSDGTSPSGPSRISESESKYLVIILDALVYISALAWDCRYSILSKPVTKKKRTVSIGSKTISMVTI